MNSKDTNSAELKKVLGLSLIPSNRSSDERGVFYSNKMIELFRDYTIDLPSVETVEVNTVINSGLVRRGLHFQKKVPQSKWITVLFGAIIDVVVDLRPNSPTFKNVAQLALYGSMQRSLFIPKGCAHGYQTLSSETIVQYVTDEKYDPLDQYGINALDPVLDIRWPNVWPTEKVIVSGKDEALPLLDDYLKDQ